MMYTRSLHVSLSGSGEISFWQTEAINEWFIAQDLQEVLREQQPV